MAFSTHVRRAPQRSAFDPRAKEPREEEKINAEMQRLDDIRQQHADMAQERQTRRYLNFLQSEQASLATPL